MAYTALPTEVVNFITKKQCSSAWLNNQYRTNGILNKNAFKKAYEINYSGQNETTYKSCVTLDDLTRELSQQNCTLWKDHPWKHYDVKSSIFTLEELHTYIEKRNRNTNNTS